MIFLKLILTNLRRHRIRSFISIAGIAFAVAAMLTVVTILQGAIGMFSNILSSDSEIIVFERNVSDLFFSNVPASAAADIAKWSTVRHADPVLFGIVSSADHPIITCFGVTPQDARIRKATWLAGDRIDFGKNNNDVVLGSRAADFLNAIVGSTVPIGHGTFHVIGILKTANGFEDGGVFMSIAAAQGFFHKDGSSVVTIKLRNKEDAAAFKAQIRQSYPNLIALEDSEFSHTYSQFKILKATAWAVGGCGLILGGLGVANTMIMSVFHAHSGDRHPARQRLLERANCRDDLRRVLVCSRDRRHRRTHPWHCRALYPQARAPALDGYVDALDEAAPYARRRRACPGHRRRRRTSTPPHMPCAFVLRGGASFRMSSLTTNPSRSDQVVLRAASIWKSYEDGTITVLRGVDFEASSGETIALCGPSGCGKSTLLHLFGGLDSADGGRIVVNGVEINRHRDILKLSLRHECRFCISAAQPHPRPHACRKLPHPHNRRWYRSHSRQPAPA